MPENAQKPGITPRPPIVVVMGHVDHGKTTLLDYIRKTNVAAREAGGITQSIGAYEIEVRPKGEPKSQEGQANRGIPQQARDDFAASRKITFIDTPGHEAFSAMRARGANVADLAILVVAATEGVKPQTKESIAILKESKTPFIVAITKIDAPGADVEKTKNDLTANDVLLEGYGGNVSYQPISAKTGEHVNDLLDLILLAADVERFTCDPLASASGFVLEARLDRRRGNEVGVIIKNGTLRHGDQIATATASGKVKILETFTGDAAKELQPSAPALVIGFERLPQVGEEFVVGPSAALTTQKPASLLAVSKPNPPAVSEDKMAETLHLIVKAENAGSLEALLAIVGAMITEKPVKIVSSGVGDVVDSDVKLAISAKATILAFANRIDKAAKNLAEANRVRIIESKIIYELVKAVEDFLRAGAAAVLRNTLEVLAVFNQQKLSEQVVGGKVSEGVLRNKMPFEIERAGAVVGRGRFVNLQQQKKDAREVQAGNECGLLVNAEVAIMVGDKLIVAS